MDWKFIVYIVVAIVGIAVPTIIAIRLARKKRPVWAYRTEQIIGLGSDAPPELKLYFNEKPIPNVFRTTLLFFNLGNEAIRRIDVTDKITLCFHGAEILRDPHTMQTSKPEIRMSIEKVTKNGDSAVELDFEYLSHHDGALIEVLHTQCDDIECKGNVIDSREIKNIGKLVQTRTPLNNIFRILYFSLMGLTGLAILLWSLITTDKSEPITLIFTRVLVPFTFIMVGFAAIPDLRRYFHSRKFPKWSLLKE